jgi:hypothetical protein
MKNAPLTVNRSSLSGAGVSLLTIPHAGHPTVQISSRNAGTELPKEFLQEKQFNSLIDILKLTRKVKRSLECLLSVFCCFVCRRMSYILGIEGGLTCRHKACSPDS